MFPGLEKGPHVANMSGATLKFWPPGNRNDHVHPFSSSLPTLIHFICVPPFYILSSIFIEQQTEGVSAAPRNASLAKRQHHYLVAMHTAR